MGVHNPAHPGEILRELVIVPLGLSVTDAADHLGVSLKTLLPETNPRPCLSCRALLSGYSIVFSHA